MAQTIDIKNEYLKQAQNNAAGVNPMLNDMYDQAVSVRDDVLKQAYGTGTNYEQGKSFYDYGANVDGYNKLNDYENALKYNAANQQIYNAQQGMDQANILEQNYNNLAAQQGGALQNSQRYAAMAKQVAGLGTQGISESSNIGIMNNYANNMANARQGYNDDMLEIYRNVAQQNGNIQNDLSGKLTQIKQTALENNYSVEQEKALEKQAIQEQENINKLSMYGVDSQMGINPNEFNAAMLDNRYYGQNKKGDNNADDLIKAVRQYGQYVPDGTIIDMNTRNGLFGQGNAKRNSDKYIFVGGKMYKYTGKNKPTWDRNKVIKKLEDLVNNNNLLAVR